MTFIPGERCTLLPAGCKSKQQLEMVIFMSFQLVSKQASAIGRMWYKVADGTHGKVEPQAVGERILLAQLLHLNRVPEPPEEPQPAAKRRKLEAAHADSHASSQEGAAEDGTAAAGKRVMTDEEKQRHRERNGAAAEACQLLSGREDWQREQQPEQLGARSFGRFKVAAAAQCRDLAFAVTEQSRAARSGTALPARESSRPSARQGNIDVRGRSPQAAPRQA